MDNIPGFILVKILSNLDFHELPKKYIYLENSLNIKQKKLENSLNIKQKKLEEAAPEIIFHTKKLRQLRVDSGIILVFSYDKPLEYMWNYIYKLTPIKNNSDLLKNI